MLLRADCHQGQRTHRALRQTYEISAVDMVGPNAQVPTGSSCLARISAASREVVLPLRDQLFLCEDSWFPLWKVILLPAYFPFEHVAFVCHTAHAELLQHFNGTNIIIETFSRNQVNFRPLEGPSYEALCHFCRIAVLAIFWDNAVPDFDGTCCIWPSFEPYIAYEYPVRLVNDEPVPYEICRVLFHLCDEERQGVQKIWPRPSFGYTGLDKIGEARFIAKRHSFHLKRERYQE